MRSKDLERLRRPAVFAVLALAISSVTYLACDDDSNVVKEPSPDSGAVDSASGGVDSSSGDSGTDGPTDCVQNPKTHLEIINACTTATRITKNPTLNKLLPDGGLPSL